MIWQYFFISLIISNQNNINRILRTKDLSVQCKIPIAHSQDLSTKYNQTNELLSSKKQNSSFFYGPGSDYRYSANNSESDIIFNITKFNKQMSVLKTLENKNIPQKIKIDLIEQQKKDELPSPMKLNILAGGLTTDWNYDIYEKLK
jgi:hypothetical protein